MARQPGLFDVDDRLRWLNEAGDPFARLRYTVVIGHRLLHDFHSVPKPMSGQEQWAPQVERCPRDGGLRGKRLLPRRGASPRRRK